MQDLFKKIEDFVNQTRDVVYLREADRIMIVRPNKIQHLNQTAFEMLFNLYKPGAEIKKLITILAKQYRIEVQKLTADILDLINNLSAIINEDYSKATLIETIPFDPSSIKYPVISEIALTYKCQNKCDFCYASSPYRGDDLKEMSTKEVKIIIGKIADEAHVPTISFTGGEPTLRKDLPELVAFAVSKGLRTNLISNGIRCADLAFVKKLASAGLHSAQISLEAADEALHNEIVGNKKAFKSVVAGIHNLKEQGIYTHTNTTICRKNYNKLIPLIDFIKSEYNNPYLSMNMIITTGIATDNENIDINYSSIGEILKPVLIHAERVGIKFVWYSPTPYCVFNPVDHGLGAKSCACVSGLLSVNPAGEILPCSSYEQGIGSLLKHSFEYIWNSDQALYYRDKKYRPPVCKDCEYDTICGGACPLYWEHRGSFKEIEDVKEKKPVIKNWFWNIENKLRVRSKGVKGIK